MHEYSLVSALLDRVAREAAAHPGAAVRRVQLRIGALAGVEPTLLATAFETCRAGSACADAELDIVHEPASWRCPRCDREIAPGEVLRCAACSVPARLVSGGDVLLTRVELLAPDDDDDLAAALPAPDAPRSMEEPHV